MNHNELRPHDSRVLIVTLLLFVALSCGCAPRTPSGAPSSGKVYLSGGYSTAEEAARVMISAPMKNNLNALKSVLYLTDALPSSKRSAYASNYEAMISSFDRVAERCKREGSTITEVLGSESIPVPQDMQERGALDIKIVQLTVWGQNTGVRETVTAVVVQHAPQSRSPHWYGMPVGASSNIIR